MSTSAGESRVSGTLAEGTLGGLSNFTSYSLIAQLVRSGSVVDTSTASFTTSGPQPRISFNFSGSDATNFRMEYTGLTNIIVRIDITDSSDVDHVRNGLDPTQTYTHNARRTNEVGLLPIKVNNLEGFRAIGNGPGGNITVIYGDPGGDSATVNFYRARGWSVSTEGGIAGQVISSMRRTFTRGSYS